MEPQVQSYARQTLESANPLARFAHRTRYAKALNLVADHAPQGGSTVDYGAGPGVLVDLIAERRPDLNALGFDPYSTTGSPLVKRSLDEMPAKVDVISAFEVCEHLVPEGMATFRDFVSQKLADDGHLIVSVPIMTGPVLVIKQLNNELFKRNKNSSYSVGEIVRGVLGQPVDRRLQRDGLRFNHKGFDWRAFRDSLLGEFAIVEQSFSPTPFLPAGLNSQWFAVLKKR